MFEEQLRSSRKWRIRYRHPNSKGMGRGALVGLGYVRGGRGWDLLRPIIPAWGSLSYISQRGVQPNLRRLAGLRSSCPSSIFTTPSFPFSAAHQSGVRPSLPGLSGLTSSRPSNIFNTPSCPFKAAQ